MPTKSEWKVLVISFLLLTVVFSSVMLVKSNEAPARDAEWSDYRD